MKIGVITFHRAINYGALFQCYALNKAINDLGGECETIDYQSKYFKDYYKLIKIKNKPLRDIVRMIITYNNNKKKYNKFQMFIDRNLTLSKICTNHEQLRELNSSYDCFITGSDQVWNFNLSNDDTAYFLDFVNDSNKKNSYAASVGISNLSNDIKGVFKRLLSDYKNISVREESAAKLIQPLIDNKVKVVLDPTFLITKSEWEEIAVTPSEEGYILLFTFFYSESILNFTEELAKNKGLKIITIGNSFTRRKTINYHRSVGPEEFLGLIKNASYVITDSFHGTAFSINFNKEFFVQMPEGGVHPRINALTNILNIKNREIIDGNLVGKYKKIDYKDVNKRLDDERNKSLEYLRGIINE